MKTSKIDDVGSVRRFINASEIHQFFYCPYAWWNGLAGPLPEQIDRLQKGDVYHRRKDEVLGKARAREVSSHWLLTIGIGLLALAIIYFVLRVL